MTTVLPSRDPEQAFVRVYQLPEKLTNGFCFGAGVPITFINVDWFGAFVTDGKDDLERVIRAKRYIKPGNKYLVLSDHPDFTFRFDA
jgi:hypothetical protein